MEMVVRCWLAAETWSGRLHPLERETARVETVPASTVLVSAAAPLATSLEETLAQARPLEELVRVPLDRWNRWSP